MSTSRKEIQQKELFVNTFTWRWKRWDVRADGKVFWQYNRGKEFWLSWEKALETREIIKISGKKHRHKHIERYKKLNDEWRAKNADRHRENSRKWGKLNRERCAANKRRRDKERRENDPIYAIRGRLRARISTAMRDGGYTKKSSVNALLGADYQTVKKHLESKFQDGMTWENRDQWHIDHIIPLASAKNEAELIQLCHYTNTQPLWAHENLAKGAIV